MGFISVLSVRSEISVVSRYVLKLSSSWNCSYWMYGAEWNMISTLIFVGMTFAWFLRFVSKSLFKFFSSVNMNFVLNLNGSLPDQDLQKT